MVKVQFESDKIRWAFQYKEFQIKIGFNFDQFRYNINIEQIWPV